MAINDGSGPDAETGVDTAGNDAFANAFEGFASGNAPDADEPNEEADDDEAGQNDRDDDGDLSPSEDRDDNDPPANAPGDTPAAGDQAADPWANATPAQKAAIDKMKADYEAKVRGAAGRASGLQRQLNALQSGTAAPPPAAKQQEQSEASKALADKAKQLREDYPEIAGPLIDLIEAQRTQLDALTGQVAPVIESTEQEVIAQQARALEATHPDWRDYAPEKNADFRGWIEAQTPTIQALATSYDAQEVGVALTLFKAERAEAIHKAGGSTGKTATPDPRRQRQMDGGKAVGSRASAVTSGAPDDFTGAFEHFASKIDKKK